jgi:serine/threonine protein kinase
MDLIRKMLCVNQSDRWTARQLLEHPWITAHDDHLAAKDLSPALAELKRFNARRKFRSATDAVMLTNRLKKITIDHETIDHIDKHEEPVKPTEMKIKTPRK